MNRPTAVAGNAYAVRRSCTAARLAANRANAQKSTGPKTAAGKKRAAQNARRHGLTVPVECDSGWQHEIAPRARLLAGANADPHLAALALQVAAAQVDLIRVCEARIPLLEAGTFEAIPRLSAIDRYAARVRSRRYAAMRAFAAAKFALLEAAGADLPKRTQAAPGLCENQPNASQPLSKRTQAEPPVCQNEAKAVHVLPKRTQPEAAVFAKTKPTSGCRKLRDSPCGDRPRWTWCREAITLSRPDGEDHLSATNLGFYKGRAPCNAFRSRPPAHGPPSLVARMAKRARVFIRLHA
jgi:hypothetical protein